MIKTGFSYHFLTDSFTLMASLNAISLIKIVMVVKYLKCLLLLKDRSEKMVIKQTYPIRARWGLQLWKCTIVIKSLPLLITFSYDFFTKACQKILLPKLLNHQKFNLKNLKNQGIITLDNHAPVTHIGANQFPLMNKSLSKKPWKILNKFSNTKISC